MAPSKNIFFTILFSSLFLLVSTAGGAVEKTENPATEEIAQAVETTVKNAEETLKSLNNGADKATTLKLLQKTGKAAKEIEDDRLKPLKIKASSQMEKAKSAAQEDDLETALEHIAKGVEYYHELREVFYTF